MLIKKCKVKIAAMIATVALCAVALSGCVIVNQPGGGYCQWHRCWGPRPWYHHWHHHGGWGPGPSYPHHRWGPGSGSWHHHHHAWRVSSV